MTRKIMMFVLVTFAAVCAADDDPPGPQPAPRQAAADVPSGAPISRTDSGSDAADSAAAAGTNPARFATEARWATAGYNNEEIIYTILVTNQDSRIIRCTTQIKGAYFDNGQKLSIEDRQVSTVFPSERTQIGNWMGMDQASGATYSVKCKPV
jgi:hypothetical protein